MRRDTHLQYDFSQPPTSGVPKGMRPLRGEYARGLAPSAGAVGLGCRAERRRLDGSIPLASSILRLFVQTAHWSKTLFTIPARHRRLPTLHSTHHTTPLSPAAGARPSGMISRSGTNALFQALLAFLVHEETADEDGQHNGCERKQCTVHGVRLPFIP